MPYGVASKLKKKKKYIYIYIYIYFKDLYHFCGNKMLFEAGRN